MFTRRIGKSPKQQLNIWNNYLSNVTSNKTSVLDDDYQSNNNITGWSYEEDEDADIPDYKSNQLHTKKRMTRMRNNNATTTNTLSANASINSLASSTSSSNLKHSTRIASGLSDSFINEYKSSSRNNSFDDIEDIPILNTTANNLTNNLTNNQTSSFSNNVSKKSVKFVDSNSGGDKNTNGNIYSNMKQSSNNNMPLDEKSADSNNNSSISNTSNNSNINVVTIEDLRSTFNDNMITKTTAYKTNLSLDVRIHLKAPALSDDILVLSGNSITWNELLDLAQPYIKRNKEITLPTVNRYSISPNTSSNRLSATSLLRESDVRSFSSDDDNSSPDKSPDISPEKFIDRYMTRSSDKTADKSIDKSPDRSMDKANTKSLDRPVDRSKSNNFNQPTSQLSKISLLDNSTNVYTKKQTTYPNNRNGISVNSSVDSINNEKWHVNDSIETTRSIDSNVSSNSPTKSHTNTPEIVDSPNKQLHNHISENSQINNQVNSPVIVNNNAINRVSSGKVNSQVNNIVTSPTTSNNFIQANSKLNSQSNNNANQSQYKHENQAIIHTTSNGQPPINPTIKSNSGSFHTANSSSTDTSDQININANKKISDLQSFDGSFYLSDSSMDDSFYTSKKSNSSRNNSFRFDLTNNSNNNVNNNINLNKIIEEEYETQSELDENKSVDAPIDDSQNIGKQIDKSKGKVQPPLMSNSPKSKSYSMKIASFFSRKSGSKMNDSNVNNNVPTSPLSNNDVNISPRSNTTVSSQTNVQPNQSVNTTPDIITSNDVDSNISNINVLTTKSSKLILPIPISLSNNPTISLSKSIQFEKAFPHLVTVPLSEYAQMSGVIIESWLEKKSKRTGLWNKKYYVLSESNSDFCILKIYKKAVETVWGIVPIDIKSVVTIKSIDIIRLVNAKSGKDFDIILKPKETLNIIKIKQLTSSTQSLNISPDNNIISLTNRSNSMNNIITTNSTSNNQTNNQAIDSINLPNNLSNSQILQRPNVSDSVNSNQMISLQRSLSSNNNLDGTGSVNSDSLNYNNLNPTLVMHLRALDAQTRLLWMNSLQHILDIYNNQYSD